MFFTSRGDKEKFAELILEGFELVKRHPGKALGIFVGFFSYQFSVTQFALFTQAHFLAMFLGLAIGTGIDIWLKKRRDDPLAKIERLRGKRRIQFFRVLFSVMGHIAKSDGRVSKDEIKVARGIMSELNLSKDEVNLAIKSFTRGKDADFPLANTLFDFYENFRYNIGLRERFIRVQIQAVLAGDGVSRVVANLLNATAAQLDIPSSRIQELLKEARIYNSFTTYGRKTEKTHNERNTYERRRSADEGFNKYQSDSQSYKRDNKNSSETNKQSRNDLAEAHIVLGVSVGDDIKAIKRAYRRLISQYHPDKLIGRGANSAERELAHAKTIEIREAYELIKKTRGF